MRLREDFSTMTIGERLKELRERNRMTLEEVAKYLNIGRPTVFKYENGTVTNIPSDKIEMLARLYGVSPAYIMGWEESSKSQSSNQTRLKSEKVQILMQDISKLDPEDFDQLHDMFYLMFKKKLKEGDKY